MPKRGLLLEMMKIATTVITNLRIKVNFQIKMGFMETAHGHADMWNLLRPWST